MELSLHIKSYGGHYHITDSAGNFVSSADTMEEAARDVEEMLRKDYNDTGGKIASS